MGIKNGCNEGLNGGGKVLGQGAGKSQVPGARAEGVKKNRHAFAGAWVANNYSIHPFRAGTEPQIPNSAIPLLSANIPGLLTNSLPSRASSQKVIIYHYFVTLIARWQRSVFITHVGGSALQTIFEVSFGKKQELE